MSVAKQLLVAGKKPAKIPVTAPRWFPGESRAAEASIARTPEGLRLHLQQFSGRVV
jgi:hypothetical protein